MLQLILISASCVAGQFISEAGACVDCPVNTYQPVSEPYADMECLSCDPGEGTREERQTSRDACEGNWLILFYWWEYTNIIKLSKTLRKMFT